CAELVGLEGSERLAGGVGITGGRRHAGGDEPAAELARGRRCDETAGTDHGPGVTGAALVDEVRGVDDPGLVLGLGVEVGLLDHLPGGGYSLVVAEGAKTVELDRGVQHLTGDATEGAQLAQRLLPLTGAVGGQPEQLADGGRAW